MRNVMAIVYYYEDIQVGQKITVGTYVVDKGEMVEFARKWDPRPFHIDEETAKSHPHGGLTASSSYIMSVVTRLTALSKIPVPVTFGLLGYEKVRIHSPVRPGDCLTVTVERIGKRESRSKPDRGIVRSLIEVRNQNSGLVFSCISSMMAVRRPA